MPMGATLALRSEDKGFTRKIDGAKLRSSVPHGHFAPLLGTLVGFNRLLYWKEPRLSWQGRGKEPLGQGAGGKGFFFVGYKRPT
jgi:hypothetical protein